MNNSEETRIEINDKKNKKAWLLQLAMDKYQKSIGHKSCALKNDKLEKNFSVHYATNNWMIVIRDGKVKGHRMMTDKIIELDQLLILSSQITKKEAERFMKKNKIQE